MKEAQVPEDIKNRDVKKLKELNDVITFYDQSKVNLNVSIISITLKSKYLVSFFCWEL